LVAGIGTLVLLAGAVTVAILLIDADAVKRKVEQRISAAIGGEVSYESVSLGLLPQPRVRIHGLKFSIPDAADGGIAVVDVRIALLPLISGNVRPKNVRVEQAEVTVRFSASGSSDPYQAYREALAPTVDGLVREAQGMSLEVAGGKLSLIQSGQRVLALSALNGNAQVSSEAIVVMISGASDRWQSAQARLRLVPGSLAATASLQVSALDAAALLDRLLAKNPLRVRPDPVGLKLEAATDGRSNLQGTAVLTAPRVVISRTDRSFDLGATGFELAFSHDRATLALTLKDFFAGEWFSGVGGTLRSGDDGAGPVIELQVPGIDLQRTRDAVLVLAGDAADVPTWLTSVSAGMLKGLQLRASAKDYASLWKPQSLQLETGVEKLGLALPAHGLAVNNGAGRFEFDGGSLKGVELSGISGKSSFKDGTLHLELVPVVSLQSIGGSFDADLGEALAVARRFQNRRDEGALAAIETLQGRAALNVSYEARRGKPHLAVKAVRLKSASGRLRSVPFAIAVNQGEIAYTDGHLALRGIAGSAGGSRLQGGFADIALGAAPVVSAARGSFVLVFDELYPWLASLDALRKPLSGLTGVTGSAELELARLSGPMAQPGAFDFEAAVKPRDLRISGSALPGPLTLASGTAGVTPQSLRLERLTTSLLDAKAMVSGTVNEYAVPTRNLQLALSDGTAGPQSLEWVQGQWALPARVMPRAPLALSSGKIEWQGKEGGMLLAQGAAGLAGGAQTEFDFSWRPGSLDLRRFTLKDADSDATLALKWSAATVETAFSGRLSNSTIERVLVHAQPERGSIHGDFRAAIDLREPRRSTAAGKLEGEGIDLFEHWGLPLVIDRFRMTAAGETLQLQDSRLRLYGQAVGLSGSARRANDTFVINARAVADRIDVQRIINAYPRSDASHPGSPWNLPAVGKVEVAAGSLTYGGHELQQLAGMVSFEPNRIMAELTDARLCDIRLPLTAVIVPGRVEMKTQIKSRGGALGPTVSCLAGEHLAVSGTYDLDAEVSASGRADALLKAARGSFSFAAHAGRISRVAALSRTLELDEIAGRMETASGKPVKDGIDYDKFTAAGTFEGSRVRLDRVTLDSPLLGATVAGEIGLAERSLALQGLVAPLDTLSRTARRIPLVGSVLGASIVVVPVSVTGSFEDPKVKVLEAAAVGATLINLMVTTFKAPIQLLDSAMGKAGTPP